MKNSPMAPRKKPLQNTTPIPRGDSELKRTPMPDRKAPLPRQRLPLSGSSLSRAARQPIGRKPWRPSRTRVSPEEVQARRLVAIRAGRDGLCEGCGLRRGTDWSHRIGRGVGGPWAAGNGMWMCREDHDFIGDMPTAARVRFGWRLRSTDNYLTEPAWFAAHGWVLLDDAGGFTPTERRAA